MRRVLLAGAMLALLSACGAQSDETAAAEQAANPAAAAPLAAAPAETPAPAEAPSAPVDLAKGDTVEVTVQTECFEVGPDADETPWDVYPGVSKEVLAVEGDKLRVTIGGTECLLPANAVKKT